MLHLCLGDPVAPGPEEPSSSQSHQPEELEVFVPPEELGVPEGMEVVSYELTMFVLLLFIVFGNRVVLFLKHISQVLATN